MNRKLRKLAIPGLLAAGIGAGATMAGVMKDPVPDALAQQAAPAVYNPNAAAPGSPAALSSAFRTASHAAMSAVVQVRVQTAARTVSQGDRFRGTPFEGMFGGGQMRVPPQAGSGSGFIISADGYVVTNNHVVDEASRVTVVMNDKREFTARVVGRDPNTDIAVVKIDGRGLPTARLGDSDGLDVGDWVLALGYPLELGQTTTAGIVSAKGRSIGIMSRDADSRGATAPLEHYIQTDAAINPGNSGGPLVDLQGSVVGVNSAIASPTGYYSGYGFAVPINLARRVAADLIRYGVVHRPMMGVQIRDVTNADAEVFGLPSPDGAVVASEPRGAAALAGLRMGDVIVALDGQPVRNQGDLMETVMRREPGDEIRIDYVRYGSRRSTSLRLTQMDLRPAREADADAAPAKDAGGGDALTERIGVAVTQLTPSIAQELRVSGTQGVVVTAVDPMGPAAGQLGRGIVIERVNGRAVTSVEEWRQAISALRPGQVVSINARLPEDGTQTIINFRLRS